MLGGKSGDLPKFATVLVTGTALAAAGMSVAAMLSDEPAT